MLYCIVLCRDFVVIVFYCILITSSFLRFTIIIRCPFSVPIPLAALATRRDIMDRCARYLSKPALTPTGQPFKVTKLIRKNFVEKHQLQSDLLSKISLVDGERVYFDSDRRHHKSDGIIFQPDTPYTFSIDSDLLKWKWQEVRTVDLQILVVPNTGTQQGSKGKGGHYRTLPIPLYVCGKHLHCPTLLIP